MLQSVVLQLLHYCTKSSLSQSALAAGSLVFWLMFLLFKMQPVTRKAITKKISHIRRWTPALRSPLQVYIPLSQHHATSASPPARSGKTSYAQGPLLSEAPFALGNMRGVENSKRASLSVTGLWRVSNWKNLLTSPQKMNGPGWRRQDLWHINKVLCQFQPY